MALRNTSVIRAVGAAGAVLTPSRRAAAVVTGSTYAASRALDPGGVTVISISLDDAVTTKGLAMVESAKEKATAAAAQELETSD